MGGGLTLQNGILLGPDTVTYPSYGPWNGITKTAYDNITSHCRAIQGTSGSEITLKSCEIGRFATTKGSGGAVSVSGGTLNARGCFFGYVGYNYTSSSSKWVGLLSRNGGAIYADDGADVTIDTCNLRCNISCDNTVSAGDYDHGGGSIYIGSGSTAKILNNSFLYTFGYGYGGAIHLDQAKDVSISEDNWFTYTTCDGNFNLSTSDKGYGFAGGLVYSRISTKLVIDGNSQMQGYGVLNNGDRTGGVIQVLTNSGSETTISNNEIYDGYAASYGGGIYLKLHGGKTTLEGNHIYHNRATRGGGIFIQNTGGTLSIPSGTIENNAASTSGGGIDYTTHKQQTLYLTNVLLTGNMAARGGAYWGCPASETTMYTTQGAAIYGNTVLGTAGGNPDGSTLDASGDDIRYEAEGTPDKWSLIDSTSDDPFTLLAPTETTQLTLSSRLLGGASAAWYQDEADDRYESGDTVLEKSAYTKTRQSIGIHSEASDQAKTLADSEAKLIIKDNVVNYYYKGFDTENNGKYDESSTRGRGGGIASNSSIVFGLDEDVTVNVEKTWADATMHSKSDEVYVDLYRVDAEGNKVKLEEHVKLKEDGDKLTTTFTALPSSYLDANGEEQKYTYEVTEEAVDGWVSDVTESYDSSSRTYNFSIKNTPESVKVTYHANNGESENSTPIVISANIGDLTFGTNLVVAQVEKGADHTILSNDVTAFTHAGYTFTGWNTTADGSGTDYAPGDVLKGLMEDEDLYAQWEHTTIGDSDGDSDGGKDAKTPEKSAVSKSKAKTGDDENIFLPIALLLASGLCIAGLELKRRKARADRS